MFAELAAVQIRLVRSFEQRKGTYRRMGPMRLVGCFSGLLLLGFIAAACSSAQPGPTVEPGAVEDVKSTSEAIIITGCDINTVGLPCDPDGPMKPRTECEGSCVINQ